MQGGIFVQKEVNIGFFGMFDLKLNSDNMLILIKIYFGCASNLYLENFHSKQIQFSSMV